MPAVEYSGVDQEGAFAASDAAAPPHTKAEAPHRGRVACGALAAAALLGLAGTYLSRSHATRAAGSTGEQKVASLLTVKAKGDCGGPDDECTASQCCQDGGPSGYQCYAKNDQWAQCLETCQEGEHEGETTGTYDKTGTFIQDKWTCDKLGERSKKECKAVEDKKTCKKEKDRCFWGWKDAEERECQEMCSSIESDGACSSLAHCMWHEGACSSGCGTYIQENKCPSERCMWNNDMCKPACWTMMDSGTCENAKWDQGCIWQGEQCIVDPCAAGDEDCTDSKCCSAARGGQGKSCFKKDKNYAKCWDVCDEEGWACEKLGNRTRWEAGCSWIGHDCQSTGLCCQEGAACVVKDELFTGCVQTKIITTWMVQPAPIPTDWEGTVLGGCRAEYEVPAASGDEERMGTTLFCFMAYLPGSEEVQLMETAKKAKASIFQCDLHSEFESWESGTQQWDTGEGGASITNTDVFLNVWQQVQADGKFLKADWTVKVDPDALLIPDRLKAHIAGLNPPANRPIYLKNNGMDPGLGNNGFLGAFEAFSKQAVQIYLDNYEGCSEAFGLDTGEDGFLKGCMDALGVGFMTDENFFKPDFSPGACIDEGKAGFHPLKEHSQWLCCLDLINGKFRDVKFGKCDMGPDGTGPEVEPTKMY